MKRTTCVLMGVKGLNGNMELQITTLFSRVLPGSIAWNTIFNSKGYTILTLDLSKV